MNTDLAKKLRWKPGMNLLLLNAPKEHLVQLMPASEEGALTSADDPESAVKSSFELVLLFVKSAAELKEWSRLAVSSVEKDGLLWIAYPKKTSKIKTDIHRDQGWEPIAEAGLEGIALVSRKGIHIFVRFHARARRDRTRRSAGRAGQASRSEDVFRPTCLYAPQGVRALDYRCETRADADGSNRQNYRAVAARLEKSFPLISTMKKASHGHDRSWPCRDAFYFVAEVDDKRKPWRANKWLPAAGEEPDSSKGLVNAGTHPAASPSSPSLPSPTKWQNERGGTRPKCRRSGPSAVGLSR